MKAKTAIALILSLVLIVLGAAVTAISLFAIDFDFGKLNSLTKVENTYTVKEDFTSISAKGLENDIRLVLSQTNECKIFCREYNKVAHTAKVENGALTITRNDSRKWYDYIGVFFDETEIIIHLPKTQYDTLTVGGSSCDIDVPADFTFEEVDISTNTGDVEFFAAVNENIEVSTDTGDITLSGLKSKNINISADTGDVELESVVATGSITVTTDTGDIELSCCDAHKLSLNADTGDISGTLLTGKTFNATSNTGDIIVPDSALGGVCEIKTDTGDIYIKVK